MYVCLPEPGCKFLTLGLVSEEDTVIRTRRVRQRREEGLLLGSTELPVRWGMLIPTSHCNPDP